MEARVIENLNLSQGFDRRRIEDWQFQDLYIPTLLAPHHQTTRSAMLDIIHLEPWSWVFASEPSGMSPGQIPEAESQMTPEFDRSHGNFWDEFRVFQIHADGFILNLQSTDQDGSLRPTEDHLPGLGAYSPFIRGDNARPCDPNRCSNALHGQPSGVSESSQELEYGTHSISPLQRRPGQTIEALEFTGPPRAPEVESAQDSKRDKGGSQEWFCRHSGCNKSYGRRQELERHRRDKHKKPRKCPICGSKWTRADMIRSHLITRHEDCFSEEERRRIRHLRGRIDTIYFLKGIY